MKNLPVPVVQYSITPLLHHSTKNHMHPLTRKTCDSNLLHRSQYPKSYPVCLSEGQWKVKGTEGGEHEATFACHLV
jgi:hypothetical protein